MIFQSLRRKVLRRLEDVSVRHLVLTLKTGHSVEIDGPCVVKVLSCDMGRALVGFDAPPTTRILRSELMKDATTVA